MSAPPKRGIEIRGMRPFTSRKQLEEELVKIHCAVHKLKRDRARGTSVHVLCKSHQDALNAVGHNRRIRLWDKPLSITWSSKPDEDIADCFEDKSSVQDLGSDGIPPDTRGSSFRESLGLPKKVDSLNSLEWRVEALKVSDENAVLSGVIADIQYQNSHMKVQLGMDKELASDNESTDSGGSRSDSSKSSLSLTSTGPDVVGPYDSPVLPATFKDPALLCAQGATQEAKEGRKLKSKKRKQKNKTSESKKMEAKDLKEDEAKSAYDHIQNQHAQLKVQLDVAKDKLRNALRDLQQARVTLSHEREVWGNDCHKAQQALEMLRKAFRAQDLKRPDLEQVLRSLLEDKDQIFQEQLAARSAMGYLKVTFQGLWYDLCGSLAAACAAREEEHEAAKALFSCKIQKEKEELRHSLAQAEEDRQRVLGEAEELKRASEGWKNQLDLATERLETIRKDLGERLLCPISFQPMSNPVMGSDLRTYQKDAIEQALDVKKASPFTRCFMEKGSLRPNFLAADLMEIMTRSFPDWEANRGCHTGSDWNGPADLKAGKEETAPEEASARSEPLEELSVMQLQEQLLDLEDEEPGAILMLKHTTALARMYQKRAIEHISSHFLKLGVQVKRVSLYKHLDAEAKDDPNPGARKRPQTRPRPPKLGYVVLKSIEDAETVLKLPREHTIQGAAVCVHRFSPEIAWPERS